MPHQLCPHCGANREGMPDSIPCWRCKRLPHTAIESTNPPSSLQQQPFQEPTIQQQRPVVPPQAPANFNYAQFQQAKHYIPQWLWLTGSFGLLLMVAMVFGAAFLFLSAEDTSSTTDSSVTSGNFSPVVSSTPTTLQNALPSLPTQSAPSPTPEPINPSTGVTNDTTADGEPFVPATSGASVEDLATTGFTPSGANAASASTTTGLGGGNESSSADAATSLPAPTEPPPPTATPILTPTPIVCPGTVLPQLVVGGAAEVVIGNTINVRAMAGLAGGVVMNIGTGERVTITGEPICTDGYLWWPVTMVDGSSGWVAEGSNTQYFLEPR